MKTPALVTAIIVVGGVIWNYWIKK